MIDKSLFIKGDGNAGEPLVRWTDARGDEHRVLADGSHVISHGGADTVLDSDPLAHAFADLRGEKDFLLRKAKRQGQALNSQALLIRSLKGTCAGLATERKELLGVRKSDRFLRLIRRKVWLLFGPRNPAHVDGCRDNPRRRREQLP